MVRSGLLASANFSLFLTSEWHHFYHLARLLTIFKIQNPIISTVALLVFFCWFDSGHLLASSNYSNFVQFSVSIPKLGLSWAGGKSESQNLKFIEVGKVKVV